MNSSAAALIIVDVQNDFVEGGSLAVPGGRAVASAISSYLAIHADEYDEIIATRDWHDPGNDNGGHFHAPGQAPDFANTWPVHCLAHSRGSDYTPELALRHITNHVRKGMGEPAYSGFQGINADQRTLAQILARLGVSHLDVVGIATDYCVKATVLDALRLGFNVRVLGALTAAVAPESGETAREEMIAAGAYWEPATPATQ